MTILSKNRCHIFRSRSALILTFGALLLVLGLKTEVKAEGGSPPGENLFSNYFTHLFDLQGEVEAGFGEAISCRGQHLVIGAPNQRGNDSAGDPTGAVHHYDFLNPGRGAKSLSLGADYEAEGGMSLAADAGLGAGAAQLPMVLEQPSDLLYQVSKRAGIPGEDCDRQRNNGRY